MKEETVIGVSQPNSPSANERMASFSKAKDARDAVNIEALYAAYEEAVTDRSKMEKTLMDVVGIGLRNPAEIKLSDIPYKNDAVAAIRDVALAAINLARDVALKGQSQERDDKGHFKPKTQP